MLLLFLCLLSSWNSSFLASCGTFRVCLLPYWLLHLNVCWFLLLCVLNVEVLQSSVLGPQYLHVIFWSQHPVDWLEVPTECWWLSQVFISCLTSPWLMFPLSFLVSPLGYLIGILSFIWLNQNSVPLKKKERKSACSSLSYPSLNWCWV